MDAEKIDENFRFRIYSAEKKKSADNENESSDEWNTSSDEANESSDGECESSDSDEDIPAIDWDMENEDLSDICYSECFSIGEKTNVFYLEICPKDEDSASMALWQLRGKSLKTFYLLIGLNYEDNLKFFLYKNNSINKNSREHPRKLNINGLYDIRNVKTNGLKEICCLVVYAEEFSETESDDGTNNENESDDEYYEGSDDKQDEENNDNKRERSSKNIKLKSQYDLEEEIISIKTRGEIAFIENMKDLFLNAEDSDLIFRVGDQTYPSHKAIIKARSSVFHSMLTHDMIEKNRGVVNIEDCNPYIFRDFLLYLYTGKLDNITIDNMFEMYHMSDKYDIKELRTECVAFIQNNLSVDNICDAISLATMHCEHVLLTRATEFLIDNVKDILTTINWQKFVQENPTKANELFIKTVNKDNSK